MQPHSAAYWFGIFIGGLFIGTLCGLLPLLVGLNKNRQTLAATGFVACLVSGLVLGLLLALPVAVIFTLILLFQTPLKR